MPKHSNAVLRHQPQRFCKKDRAKSHEGVRRLTPDQLGDALDCQDLGDQTIPTYAVCQTWRQLETIPRLYRKLAEPVLQDHNAVTPIFDANSIDRLFDAIRMGLRRTVRRLCKSDAIDTSTRDVTGRTILHLGAEQGELGLFSFLLQQSRMVIDATDASGKTALFYAVQYERAALVRRLLCTYGASVDIRDNFGRTPLSHAVEHNSYRSTELLLEAGADFTSKDDLGNTPMFYAVKAGNCAATVRLVRHSKDGNPALALAEQMGQAKIENKLMIMRNDVANWEDEKLRKLLLQSARDGRDDMIRVLLHRHGVDADTQDSDGRTSLSLAAEMGHHNIIRLLSKRGANRDLKDRKSQTPVDYALRHGASTYRCILKSWVA
jgi:ankyrin repeat protein